MNFCNFAKVIIGRSSKDPDNIQWWSSKNASILESVTNKKSSNVSASFIYHFYNNIMNKYPKMHLPYDKFVRQLPRVQNYIRDSKYWKNNNKCGEKKNFKAKFSLQQWDDLSHRKAETYDI